MRIYTYVINEVESLNHFFLLLVRAIESVDKDFDYNLKIRSVKHCLQSYDRDKILDIFKRSKRYLYALNNLPNKNFESPHHFIRVVDGDVFLNKRIDNFDVYYIDRNQVNESINKLDNVLYEIDKYSEIASIIDWVSSIITSNNSLTEYEIYYIKYYFDEVKRSEFKIDAQQRNRIELIKNIIHLCRFSIVDSDSMINTIRDRNKLGNLIAANWRFISKIQFIADKIESIRISFYNKLHSNFDNYEIYNQLICKLYQNESSIKYL
jgi:hypothetical protein